MPYCFRLVQIIIVKKPDKPDYEVIVLLSDIVSSSHIEIASALIEMLQTISWSSLSPVWIDKTNTQQLIEFIELRQ